MVEVAETAEGTVVLTYETALPEDYKGVSSIGMFKMPLRYFLSDREMRTPTTAPLSATCRRARCLWNISSRCWIGIRFCGSRDFSLSGGRSPQSKRHVTWKLPFDCANTPLRYR